MCKHSPFSGKFEGTTTPPNTPLYIEESLELPLDIECTADKAVEEPVDVDIPYAGSIARATVGPPVGMWREVATTPVTETV